MPGLLAVLIFLLFLPNLIAGRPALGIPESQDLAYQWNPYYHFLRDSFLTYNSFPLWNPYDLCGTPFLAFAHANALYPLNFLYLLFDFPLAMSLAVLLHLLIAALGSYFLFRQFGASENSSLICSLAYTLAGFLFTNLNFSASFYSAAWLPLVFLFGIRLGRNPSRLNFLGLILAAALCLYGGDLEVAVFGLLTLMGLQLILKSGGKALLLIGLALLLSGLIFLAQFLPALELVHNSIRAGSEIMISLPPKSVVLGLLGVTGSLLYPFPMSSWQSQTLKGMNQFYLGLLPLFGFLIALKEKRLRKLGWIFIIAAIYSFFLLVPFLHRFIFGIPVIGQSIMPVRLLPALELVFLAIAGIGLDRILGSSRGKLSRPQLLILIAFAALTLAAGIFFRKTFTGGGFELRVLVSIMVLALIFLPRAFPLKWIVFPLAAFDLYAWAFLHFPATDYQHFQIHPQLQATVANTDPDSRYFIAGALPADAQLPFSAGLILKAATLDSWSRAPVKRYVEVLAMLLPEIAEKKGGKLVFYSQGAARNLLQVPPSRAYLLDLLNVRWLISRLKLPFAKLPAGVKELSSAPLYIYENENALPRAFFTPGLAVLDSEAKVLSIMERGSFDYRTTLLSSDPEMLAFPASPPGTQSGRPSRVSLKRDRPDQLLAQVSTQDYGWLFLSETYYPGWKAELDGKPARIFRADHAFRAVFLPSGNHAVKFIYAPVSFRIGLYGSLASLLGLAAMFFSRRLWRKKTGAVS